MVRKKGNRVHLDIYLDPDKHEQLQQLSDASRIPVAAYMREAVDDLLAKWTWRKQIPRCFGAADVRFAYHPADTKRAREMIAVAKASGASFEDLEAEIVLHCHKEAAAWRSEHAAKQVARAKQLWGKSGRAHKEWQMTTFTDRERAWHKEMR